MLTRSQVAYLRAQAHGHKPVVRVGQRGLTEAVVAELERALADHELVKIRLAGADRATRAAWVAQLCERTGAEAVQQIGATASLFRRNADDPRITLPA
ncbi:MAG: YhbY family RNA-binding protein [Halofilum sp. (in: g-proteobacteria)]|nr:YhbY family RNA-binding protein [Halofilum sp. (in: g-proteobacteria)]